MKRFFCLILILLLGGCTTYYRVVNGIAGEVSQSLEKSNGSVMELTAVTEELAATMTEVGRNAGVINEILKVLNKAIKESESVSQVNNLTDDILTCNKQEFSHLCRW